MAAVLKELEADSSLTSRDIGERIGRSTATVERAIAALKREGSIKRVGSRKTGHWEVL
ncbi:MAG: winged helix-turn-helix domain-containing protein [Clostridiales Family XIII bacterium]|nr:winged helix-turn-helix domain-containing protein [Clostridiales Family XIII bacterium]